MKINHKERDRKDKRGGNRDPNQKISRKLSAILRHKAVEIGFQIDQAGFVSLNDIIAYLKGNGHKEANEEIIENVVNNNDKKRFEIIKKGQHKFIRATQGHSMQCVKTQQLLQKIVDPTIYPIVVHGTYLKFWDLIKKQGLKRMSRNHIHFAPGMPKQKDVISGMRSSCDIYIEIDMFMAIKDGIDFYVSSNNVILTQGIDGVLPPKYFKLVTSKKGDIILGKKEEQ